MPDKSKPPYKRSFKYRVQRRMECDGWTVCPICDADSLIELLCIRVVGGRREIVGIRVKPHGHIYKKEWDALSTFGNKLHISIFHVHESREKELAFVIIVRY